MAVVKNVIVRGGADFSSMTREVKKAQTTLRGFSTSTNKTMWKVKKALATYVGFRFFKDAVTESNKAESAFLGLESIVTAQGGSLGRAQKAINDYVEDGLVSLTDATTAYKNLISRGYNHEESIKSMNMLKDAAAFNREAHLSMSEAVVTATAGLKNSQSQLVDNAGITKNVAKMHQEYAKSIGKTTATMTEQEKIQAEINGITEATRFQLGDAAKVAQTFEGRIAALKQKLNGFKVSIGNAVKPIINVLLPVLDKTIDKITKLAQQFERASALLFGKPIINNKSIGANTEKIDNLGDSIIEAEKKAKKSVAGFDELNSLTQPEENEGLSEVSDKNSELNLDKEKELEPPKVSKFIEGLQKVKDIWAEYFKNNDTQLAKFKDNINQIGGSIKGFFDKYGIDLLTFFTNILISISEFFFGAINFLIKHKDITISVLGGLLVAFIAFKMNAVWGQIVSLFGKVSKALAFFTTPIGLIILAIAALVGAFIYLWRTNEEFRNKMIEIWGHISSLFIELWNDVIKPLAEMIYEGLIKPLIWMFKEVLLPILKVAFEVLGEVIVILLDIIIGALKITVKVLQALNKIFASTAEAIRKVLMTLGKVVVWVFEGIFNFISDIARSISGLFDGIANGFILFMNLLIKGYNKIAKLMNKPLIAKMEYRESKLNIKNKEKKMSESGFKIDNTPKIEATRNSEPNIDGLKINKASFKTQDYTKSGPILNNQVDFKVSPASMKDLGSSLKSEKIENNDDLLNGFSEIIANQNNKTPQGAGGQSIIQLVIDGKEMARALFNPLQQEGKRVGTNVVSRA